MGYKYYIADVFTNRIFSGAQIAVFPEADGLDEEQMALGARELNLSETVFVFQQQGGENKRKLRIFSPFGEVDFAGHPMIATAYVLGSCGNIKLTEKYTAAEFEKNTGTLSVNITSENGKPVFIQFTRKVVSTIDLFAPEDDELAKILTIEQAHIDHDKYSARLVSCGIPYLIVPIYYYETVRKAKFNFDIWSQSMAPQTSAQEILLFSDKTPFNDSDFNARLIGPNLGIHEDPPVGTAMPAFASYLCSFDHMRKGTYTFAVDRGDENSRRSVIHLEMDHKGEEELTIRVGGEAVMVAEGMMEFPQINSYN